MKPKNLFLNSLEGAVLIVSPHANDEALGCGGLIALCAAKNIPVVIAVITDGTQSHPRSRMFTAQDRMVLREKETAAGLTKLGAKKAPTYFLRLPDKNIPGKDSQLFQEAVKYIRQITTIHGVRTVFTPYANDPHPDHVVTNKMVMAACEGLALMPKVYEYPIWLYTQGNQSDFPKPHNYITWMLDISSVLDRKREAITCHKSQLTDVIFDDPMGYKYPPAMLDRFYNSTEIYYEKRGYKDQPLVRKTKIGLHTSSFGY